MNTAVIRRVYTNEVFVRWNVQDLLNNFLKNYYPIQPRNSIGYTSRTESFLPLKEAGKLKHDPVENICVLWEMEFNIGSEYWLLNLLYGSKYRGR